MRRLSRNPMPATGSARSGRAQEIGVDLPVATDQVGLLVVRPHARPRGPAHLLAEPGVADEDEDGPRGGGRVGEAGDQPARPARPVRWQPAPEQPPAAPPAPQDPRDPPAAPPSD